MGTVLVTGMSGTGKSTVLLELARRGHHAIDTDTDEWSHWTTDTTGAADWIWREDAIPELLGSDRDGHLFVGGCKTNQGAFYPCFDAIVLLSAPLDVLLDRIDSRVTNDYGKAADERAAILENLRIVEPLLRRTATHEIDTRAPVSEVADRLEQIAATPRE